MATEITMPKLSDTMTEGQFISWRKNVGEKIERGDVIAEVETDKAVMEVESYTAGILLKTLVKGGETVPVGTVLGVIGQPGEEGEEKPKVEKKVEPPAKPVEKEPAKEDETKPAEKKPGKAETVETTEPIKPVAEPAKPPSELSKPAPKTAAPRAADAAVVGEKASPMVRRMARELGIDLAAVHGTGPEGRVLQEDLDSYNAEHKKSEAGKAEPKAEAGPAKSGGAMRQAIAATVSRSWQEIPHFTVTVEINMQASREIIAELKGSENQLGYNALIIKGCAMALAQFPSLLAARAEEEAADAINIGFAVALPDGLLLPVIERCNSLSVKEINSLAARLAEKARAGRLTQSEMGGGSFSISNLGMYGVDEFMALIMPGQVGTLAVGAVIERPAVVQGQVVAAPLMRATLSADHRFVDGAYAAEFLAELRHLLEHPMPMFV